VSYKFCPLIMTKTYMYFRSIIEKTRMLAENILNLRTFEFFNDGRNCLLNQTPRSEFVVLWKMRQFKPSEEIRNFLVIRIYTSPIFCICLDLFAIFVCLLLLNMFFYKVQSGLNHILFLLPRSKRPNLEGPNRLIEIGVK